MEHRKCIDSDLQHRVFLYGTLIRSQHNHFRLENPEHGHARFLAKARTKLQFPLVIYTRWNIPFLLHDPGKGQQVYGEIYEVDDQTLWWLDKFEDHPEIYSRDKLTCEIVLNDVIGRVRNDDIDEIKNFHISKSVSEDVSHDFASNDIRSIDVITEVPVDSDLQDDLDCSKTGEEINCWAYFLKDFPPELGELETYSCYDSSGNHNKPYCLKQYISREDTYECLAGRKRPSLETSSEETFRQQSELLAI